MSNKWTANRLPGSLARHLPSVAGGAIILWLLVEFAFRRGLTPLLAGRLGTSLGADTVSVTIGFTLAAAGIAWWGVQAVAPADWDYTFSRRTIGAGIAGLIGLYEIPSIADALDMYVLKEVRR